jgi:hypothetical protein
MPERAEKQRGLYGQTIVSTKKLAAGNPALFARDCRHA